jgi:hypothetical protein
MSRDVKVEVVLEVGKKRVFAIARDWPGWCRSGSDKAEALNALLEYGPRYRKALKTARMRFTAPKDVNDFVVVKRIKGDSTTDFGAPSRAWSDDKRTISQTEAKRFQKILKACWSEFDKAVRAAKGRSLRKGTRGGGRNLTKIVEHVLDVDAAYLRNLGGKPQRQDNVELHENLVQVRQEILTTLMAAARGEVPKRGPRGGIRWTPRYFARRLAWHELDHAWEIENRAE